ncbi:hypothetical protein [Horticoccus sp. 23ND18S-11]|uniref:hypothetical protein n=1 Tax=Horticoccus sp. 23ND18S-11 TaxID=3391832 RepID=UPI0039C9F6E5
MPLPASSAADYHAAVIRFTAAIDRVLARGEADRIRHEAWQRRDGERLAPYVSAEAFAALPPAQRHVINRTIALTEELYRTFSGSSTAPAGAAPVAPRIHPHRDRI